MQVFTLCLNMTFHLRPIWLQTLVAINSLWFLSIQNQIFFKLCFPPSEVAVLINQNLSRRPFPGLVVNFDLLLCTGFDF